MNEKCLLRIYNCDDLKSYTSEEILKPFAKFAIAKMVRFDEKNEAVL